mgnify:CR=1 FL=1
MYRGSLKNAYRSIIFDTIWGENPYSFGLLTSFVSSCLFARLKFQCPVIGVVLNIWRMRPDALEAT